MISCRILRFSYLICRIFSRIYSIFYVYYYSYISFSFTMYVIQYEFYASVFRMQ